MATGSLPKNTSSYIIPNLGHACDVLTRLSRETSGLTLAEVSRELALPHTSALRILRTLEAKNYITVDHKRYRLGAALLQIVASQTAYSDLRSMAVTRLKQLAEQTGETAHFCVPSAFKVLILDVCDGHAPVRAASRPGTLAQMHCSATGKVFIAYLYADRLDELSEAAPLVARTKRTLCSVEAMRDEIGRIRRNGYAVDDEEYHEGVRCLAAPVKGRGSQVVGAIGITAGTQRFRKSRIREIAEIVKGVAAAPLND